MVDYELRGAGFYYYYYDDDDDEGVRMMMEMITLPLLHKPCCNEGLPLFNTSCKEISVTLLIMMHVPSFC